MKRIGKILCAALLALSISGCAQTQNKEVKILAPSGAPALGVLGAFGQENVSSVDIVSGSDVLQSELAKADSEYDVIVAPSNLGMALSSKGMDNYELAAVITWGNLYLVAEDEDALTKEGNFAAFGEGAVPQLVLENAVDVDNIVPELTYFNAVSDAQSQLLSGKADVALLAEPVATATIAKAKQNGKDLKVIADLQQLYAQKNDISADSGYPQAAIFVKKGEKASLSDVLKAIETFANETSSDQSALKAKIEEVGVDQLGVPNAEVAVKSWTRQNIRYVDASQAKQDLQKFADIFGISVDLDTLIAK